MAPTPVTTPTVAPSPTPPQGANLVRESFTFLPPPPSSTNVAHHRLSQSAAIASVQITLDSVNGGAPSTGAPLSIITNLTITTCPCTVYGPSVPPGTDTFSITTYDEPNASGNLLSSATPTYTIVAGQANNENVTLNGVPGSFTIALPSATAGTPFAPAASISVTAKDADGNTILGTYANPVTLTDADTSGATSIATSGSDNPPPNQLLSSSDSATMTYTGLAIAPVAITAKATGVSASATFAPALQPITITTTDAQNPNFAGVDLYATNGVGSTGTFSASEVGWTNAPYNQSLTTTIASGCSSIATVAPASGTSFTATVVGVPSPGTCTVTLADGSGQTQTVVLAYTQFTSTGAAQSIVIPAAVTSVAINAYGAQGWSQGSTAGGEGGEAQGTFTVAAGQTLFVSVGDQQGDFAGFNGGGAGSAAGGGGGASDVRLGSELIGNRMIVAAGGGGAGSNAGTTGGNGGGASGSAGSGGGVGGGGSGGSQSAGGSATGAAQPGGLGYGGYADMSSAGGGGGGGYYGGGGGTNGAGGGGGSSYIDLGATSASTTAGVQSGNGLVILIW
jgi:Glycine rich protein